MDLSKLSRNERTATFAAIVVVITALISVINEWGALMLVALLAGAAVVFGALQPQLAPSVSMPVSRGLLMLGGGVVAAITFVLTAVYWLEWIGDHLVALDTLQFLVGLIASLVTAWAGWRAYQESGQMSSTTPSGGTPA